VFRSVPSNISNHYLGKTICTQGPADDAYVCSRTSPSSNSVKISSAYLTGHNPPTIVSPVRNLFEQYNRW